MIFLYQIYKPRSQPKSEKKKYQRINKIMTTCCRSNKILLCFKLKQDRLNDSKRSHLDEIETPPYHLWSCAPIWLPCNLYDPPPLRLFDRSVWSSRKAEIWVWPYYLVMVTVSDYGNYVTVASRQVLLSWRSPGRGSSSSAQSVARQLPATSKGHGRGTVTLWFYVSYRFVKILTYLCGLSWTTVCSCQDCIYTQ